MAGHSGDDLFSLKGVMVMTILQKKCKSAFSRQNPLFELGSMACVHNEGW
jgi:hypothetical protein